MPPTKGTLQQNPDAPVVFVYSGASTIRKAQIYAILSHAAKHIWDRKRRERQLRLRQSSQRLLTSAPRPLSWSVNPAESEKLCKRATFGIDHFRGNSDPFSSAAIEITPLAHELLSVCHHWTLLHNYSIWAIALYEGHERIAQSKLIRNALSDPGLLHCLLATGHYVRSQHTEAVSMAAFAHKTRVLEIMQARLHAGEDISMLIDYLVPMEAFVGDFRAAEVHWRALNHVLKNASQPFQAQQLSHLWVLDVWLAYCLHRRTILDVSMWEPPLAKFDAYLGSTSGQQNYHELLVDPQLLDTIIDIRNFIVLREMATGMPDGAERDELVHWLHLRNAALDGHLLNRLLYQEEDIKSAACSSRQALNHSITLASMCFLYLTWFDQPYSELLSKNYQQFNYALRRLGSDVDQELLLWLYFMCAVNDALLPSRNDGWAKEKFNRMRYLYSSWDEARSVLAKYLYVEGMEHYLAAGYGAVSEPPLPPVGMRFMYRKLCMGEGMQHN